MATIAASLLADGDAFVKRYKWETLTTTNDVGAAVDSAYFADRSVQVTGTFDGATIIMEGSNDGGATYAALKNPLGNAVSFTAAGLMMIGDIALIVRPRISVAGSGGADLDVFLLMRGNR